MSILRFPDKLTIHRLTKALHSKKYLYKFNITNKFKTFCRLTNTKSRTFLDADY